MYTRRALVTALACFALVAVAPRTVRADDNPFGLPTSSLGFRRGAVMLHGGGRGLADEVRNEFVRLAGGKDARIVLMPSDMAERTADESVADYERRLAEPREYGRWVALRENKTVADFQFLYLDKDADDERFYSLLENATGVWLPAYDQETLPAKFAHADPSKSTRFQIALRDVLARHGVVGGLGGGMSCLPETIITSDEPGDGGPARGKLRFGLALFSGAVVEQNFSSWTGRLERLTHLLRSCPALDRLGGTPGVERRTIGVGVERHTAVILEQNSIRAIGEGRGHVFLKSNGDRTITWRTVAAGDEPLVIKSNAGVNPAVSTEERAPSADASADAPPNPFGLPEWKFAPVPVDPGTVILHGGGNTNEIIELFPKLKVQRMVHCPAARESCRPAAHATKEALAQHLEKTFSVWRELETDKRIKELSFLTTSDPADANRHEFCQPLRDADALWFCGGDQRPLSEMFVNRFEPTDFQSLARNIVARQGIVGGSSAGLAIMPEIMIEGGYSENGKPAAATLGLGLGILKNVLAEQHFDARSGRIERLTGLLKDHKRLASFLPTCEPKKLIGLAVEEDTALILQANRLRVTGKKLAHVFVQSTDPSKITWHALKPGDAAVMNAAADGWQLELDDWQFIK